MNEQFPDESPDIFVEFLKENDLPDLQGFIFEDKLKTIKDYVFKAFENFGTLKAFETCDQIDLDLMDLICQLIGNTTETLEGFIKNITEVMNSFPVRIVNGVTQQRFPDWVKRVLIAIFAHYFCTLKGINASLLYLLDKIPCSNTENSEANRKAKAKENDKITFKQILEAIVKIGDYMLSAVVQQIKDLESRNNEGTREIATQLLTLKALVQELNKQDDELFSFLSPRTAIANLPPLTPVKESNLPPIVPNDFTGQADVLEAIGVLKDVYFVDLVGNNIKDIDQMGKARYEYLKGLIRDIQDELKKAPKKKAKVTI